MSNTSTPKEGSASTPSSPVAANPPPASNSPRRGGTHTRNAANATPRGGTHNRNAANATPRGGTHTRNAANATPRGRGSPNTRRPTPPRMGVVGRSAFTTYTRPPPPPPGCNRANASAFGSFTGGVRLRAAQSVAVGASGSGGAAAPVGGNPMARKRVRDNSAAAGGNSGAGAPLNCSVCGKTFMTPKALFGHMRSHPGRGWKGAHPPPIFRADEEFADLRVNRGGPEEGAERPEEEEGANYKLPDLNNPPPPEDDSAN